MTVNSLMEKCAELGIKLALKGEASDRLQVDAPKGALTAELRDALTAKKSDLITALKTRAVSRPVLSEKDSTTVTHESIRSTPQSPEATPLILEQPYTTPAVNSGRVEVEVNNLLAGYDYDAGVINSSDAMTRQQVSTQLLTALTSGKANQHERARSAFVGHGFFSEAATQLRSADSPGERAAAARKLGAVGETKAVGDLISALEDSAPEVRRAAVESLGQLGDAAAVGPLNDLLLRETSRQLPLAVIRHAINSLGVSEPTIPRAVSSQTVPEAKEAPQSSPDVFSSYLKALSPQDSPVDLPRAVSPNNFSRSALEEAE